MPYSLKVLYSGSTGNAALLCAGDTAVLIDAGRSAKCLCAAIQSAGVDPAARDFILNTILTNYNENGTVLISTHLISDIERVLDEVIFLKDGIVTCHDTVDNLREQTGMSVDALFRQIFRAEGMEGGVF